MKKIIKIVLFTILIIFVGLIALMAIFLLWGSKQQAVKETYSESIVIGGDIENKYTKYGNCTVDYIEYESDVDHIKKFEIYYPENLENTNYPLVIMANGTGIKASKYKTIFKHLASWGFIVVGNEDGNSWSGLSSSETLDFMLQLNGDENNIFYKKIDMDNIGIGGHSQGGVGTINAVTNYENGKYYKAMYTASTTHLELAIALKWPYDVSKVKIPYFMAAGTKKIDAGGGQNAGIAPLSSLQKNYNAISNDVTKVMARRVDAEHGDMLSFADGYMTAWFNYFLKDDEEAGKAFFGENAEILNNSNWKDIQIN